ncbi:MAG: hypothetical protein BJBARM4_0383 [Candidatus Parvarchaeum acidiphilum ARMAN-4]|jgi:DNA-directed RNA polymerase subunit RPC12/RpoP|uniref:Uncharacterized protein n=1 Tax=Candidatus Parvarchaeum acidiphilum ARMAN-4 TaxID=662760 RepID=D2EF71_PARA4|nr:MAG: hypothetical protein BJBARM4_0383 [Candidatus Parvarchaeum acidiphilum ARMAN-4]
MGKNIRRGRTGNVRCASCGQITRRDRAVYLFRDGIKAYYCPDCAKKIHGQRLYKGMPKYVKRTNSSKVKRKFTIFAKDGDGISEAEESKVKESPQENEYTEKEQDNQENTDENVQESNEEIDKNNEQEEQNQENNEQ